jgi:hypothetical protein
MKQMHLLPWFSIPSQSRPMDLGLGRSVDAVENQWRLRAEFLLGLFSFQILPKNFTM